MVEGQQEVVIPSNPADRQKLRLMLEEMTHCMRRMDDERQSKKEIAQEIKNQFGIGTKYANKLAKAMYNRNFEDIRAEHSEFEDLYTEIVEGGSQSSEDEE